MEHRIKIDEKELTYLRLEKGMTVQELAKHFGVWYETIWHQLDELGVPVTKEEFDEREKGHTKRIEKLIDEWMKDSYNPKMAKKIVDDIWRDFPKPKKVENRRRFIALNKPFSGSNAHHIDSKHAIYIPAKLHQKYRHNLQTGEGMEEINTLAHDFCSLRKNAIRGAAFVNKYYNDRDEIK